MLINQALIWADQRLNRAKIKSASLDADILLSHSLNQDKSFIYAHPEYKLSPAQSAKFKQSIARRSKGEPIAYITGHKEFYGLDFFVNQHTLIPRPETEILVGQILKNNKIKTIADIGTGSGAIAITLSKNNPKLKIYASDISAGALQIATENSSFHKTNKRIIFKQGNLLAPFKNIKLDAIAANLPYLDPKLQLDKSETTGLKFEPSTALYAGPHGLNAYLRLLKQISKLKYTPSYIYLEIGHYQPKLLKKIILASLPLAKITIKKDLAGLNRLAMIYLPKQTSIIKGGG